MLGGDDAHKFMGRPRLDRADFASLMNPGSRQIYLTFPADSTFREEDVSNYFRYYLESTMLARRRTREHPLPGLTVLLV
jgi:hypothetical protein